MATVSFIPESRQSISAMKAVIDYCLQQKKVADADNGRRLVSGVKSLYWCQFSQCQNRSPAPFE